MTQLSTIAAAATSPSIATYEPPQLVLVGDARDVVLGMPGSGFDGPYGMTEPRFEFEADDDQY